MRAIVGRLRSGSWLTERRLTAYSTILIAGTALVFAAALATAHGPLDIENRPLGTDFSEVWIAGRSALAGNPAAPFYLASHAQAQRQSFGPATPIYGWHYPPYFLFVGAALALLPYVSALLVWQGVTLTFYVAAIGRIIDRSLARLCALAFPAVYVNLGHGQNGFLTAGLLGIGCLQLERHDILAGVLFGLVAYKPQFGLAIPVALIAGGHWRTLAAAASTVLAATAATIVVFGIGVWRAFLDNLSFTRQVVLERGSTGWEKIQSVFSAVRMLGGGIGAAYAMQIACGLIVIGLIFWLWRGPADRRLKAAALLPAALLTTPYCLDYDMMLLAPAIAFAVSYGLENGFRPWEATSLAAIGMAPLVARPLGGALHLPMGLAAIAALFAIAASRGFGLRRDQLAPIALPPRRVKP